MTAQELKNSVLQLAVQGKLVPQNSSDTIIDLTGLKLKKTDEYGFEVPSCWKLAHLESVTINIPTKQYQILESEVRKSGKYPVVSQAKVSSIGFTDDERKVYKHEKPVVVFGDHTTEVKYIDFDFVVGADGVKIFEPVNNVICAKFLFYVLQFYSKDLSKLGGYTRHYKYIKNKPIPIPPLAEQKRIVEKIEELMPLIEEYGKAEEQLNKLNAEFPDKLRKSILQQAVQGRLVSQDPNDEPASELFKRICAEKSKMIAEGKNKKGNTVLEIDEDEIPFEIPESWVWVRFLSVVDIKANLVSPSEYLKYLHIAPDNIEKSTGRLLECRTVEEDKVASANHLFFEGQIIYSKIRPLLRKAVIAPFKGLCSADMYPLDTYLENKYVLYYLLSDACNKQISKIIANRVKMPKINQNELSKVLFPLPPLTEQKRIVKRVEELLALCDKLKYNPLGE